jgi:hypothetical protein
MKTTTLPAVATFALFLVGNAANVHAADWTIPANPGCEVALGNANTVNSGFRANGGTAVISCPLTRKVGSNNLNWVYARIHRSQGGGAAPFCTLNSYNNFGSPNNSTWGNASAGAGNKSISLPLPTVYYSGYLSVVCVLNNGDTLYGLRYGQD